MEHSHDTWKEHGKDSFCLSCGYHQSRCNPLCNAYMFQHSANEADELGRGGVWGKLKYLVPNLRIEP